MRSLRHVIALAVGGLLATTSVAFAVKEGDRVLALRQGTNSYFAATVSAIVVEDGNTSGAVKFDDGTIQEYGPITFEPSLQPFSWVVGATIECGPDAQTAVDAGDADSPNLTSGQITAIDATTVELSAGGKKTKFPLAGCRHHRTWWDEVNARWRNYATYKTVKALPKKGAKDPSADEVSSAFSYALESADGGAYLQIKKCVTTGKKWSKINQGDDLVARSIEVACGIAIPLPPKPQENFTCLIEFGTCRQEYQGDGEYGGCQWSYTSQDPVQIACKALK